MTRRGNTRTPMLAWTTVALLVAVVGISVQIASGVDFPTVPPGIIILLVAAAVTWFGTWRWSPAVGVAAGLSQLIGLFAAGQAPRLVTFDPVGGSLGLWLQLLAVATAVASGIPALIANYRR